MRVMTFSNITGEQSRDSMLCFPPDTTGNVSLTTKMRLREDWNRPDLLQSYIMLGL